MIIIYPICCQHIRIIRPQKPYFAFRRIDVPNFDRMPSKIIDQIYPRTIPPIRLGMKKTVLNRLLPFMPCVST